MSDTLRDVFPAVYGPLLPELFDRPEIRETRATCGDCAMCDKGSAQRHLTSLFRPDLKCCTYHPTLPNYLVGAVLDDGEHADGCRRMREKIAARIGVTPEWIASPRKYRVLWEAGHVRGYGQSEALVCPYLDREGGLCTIWKHRESVCATFFCKHDRGAADQSFWMAVKAYFFHVERVLAKYAARSVCEDAAEPGIPRLTLTVEDLADRPPGDEEYARYWRGWVGREEAFYVECHRRIGSLSAKDFETIVHESGGREILAAVSSRYESVASPTLANRLALNGKMRVVPSEGGVVATTYSRHDPVVLTQTVYDVLREVRPDETVAEAIERLRRDRGLEVPEVLLLRMQQFEVMVSPPDGEKGND